MKAFLFKETLFRILTLSLFVYMFCLRPYLPGRAIHIDAKWAEYGWLPCLSIFFVGFFSVLRTVVWLQFVAIWFWRQPVRHWPAREIDFTGAFLLLISLLLYVIGHAAQKAQAGMLSMCLAGFALIWLLAGRKYAKIMMVPFIFFLLTYNNLWMEWQDLSPFLKSQALLIAGGIVNIFSDSLHASALKLTVDGIPSPIISMMPEWGKQSDVSWIPLLLAPYLGILLLFWQRVKTSWMLVYLMSVPLAGFTTQVLKLVTLSCVALWFGGDFYDHTRPFHKFYGLVLSILLEALVLTVFWKVWTRAGKPKN